MVSILYLYVWKNIYPPCVSQVLMYCSSCGTQRIEDGIFCGGCGIKFIDEQNRPLESDSESTATAEDVGPTLSSAEEETVSEVDETEESGTDDVEELDTAEEETVSEVDEKDESELSGKDTPNSNDEDETVSTEDDGYSSIQSPNNESESKSEPYKQYVIVTSVAILAGILILAGFGDQLEDQFSNDIDGDGIPDSEDAFPNNYLEQYDSDNDGVGNNGDNCPYTWQINQLDTDSDGQGDACDYDDDGDGVSDYLDNCPLGMKYGTDTDGDGCKDLGEDSDDDGDGLEDWIDYCSAGETNWYSTSTTDFDGDGCQDSSEDLDDDNDGHLDYQDWYDRGDGGLRLELTSFVAWSGGYYDADDSYPDVYAYIGVDWTCSDGDPDWSHSTYSVHSDSYELSDWMIENWNIAETATVVCIKIEIWDDDAFDDDRLDYVEGDSSYYYYTFDLVDGETFSSSVAPGLAIYTQEYDNRGENDVSILLNFTISRIQFT